MKILLVKNEDFHTGLLTGAGNQARKGTGNSGLIWSYLHGQFWPRLGTAISPRLLWAERSSWWRGGSWVDLHNCGELPIIAGNNCGELPIIAGDNCGEFVTGGHPSGPVRHGVSLLFLELFYWKCRENGELPLKERWFSIEKSRHLFCNVLLFIKLVIIFY